MSLIMEELNIPSEIMGYHEYQLDWNPLIDEGFQTSCEPDKLKDSFAASVLKIGKIAANLKNGDNRLYARTVFYFLRADPRNICTVTGIPMNHGDGLGMKVPCTLNFRGHQIYMDVLKREL